MIMKRCSNPTWLCAAGMIAAAGSAFAENPPPPAPPSAASQAPVYDPKQLPTYSGRVQQFTLTPRGDIDGLILSDGTEVKTPPHLSTAIAYSIKPGDTVSVHGLRAAALPLVQAVSVTNQANGRTIVDSGPPAPRPGPLPLPSGRRPTAPLAGLTEASGRIRMVLHGPQGDINGALLEDGTVLHLPPPAALSFSTLLQPGRLVVTEGVEFSNALGKVLEVRQLGTSRDQLNYVAFATETDGPQGKSRRPRAMAALANPVFGPAAPR
jgi:hypothetical protein